MSNKKKEEGTSKSKSKSSSRSKVKAESASPEYYQDQLAASAGQEIHHPEYDRPTSTGEAPDSVAPPLEPQAPAASMKGIRAEDLLKEPFIEETYGATYLYLTPKDPSAALAIYEVGEEARLHLMSRFGADFFEKNELILRVFQVTGIRDFDGVHANHIFEVNDELHWKTSYWLNLFPGEEYVAQLGYRAKGSLYFEHVATSNRIMIPRAAPTTEERYVEWQSVGVEDQSVDIPLGHDQWRFNQYNYWRNGSVQPAEMGYWALVLHQHLPYVRHQEYNVSLEEQWFFEAVVSVYTQIINIMWTLEREKIDFRFTVSLTPPLLSMMQDEALQGRVRRHIKESIALAEREYASSHDKPWRHTVEGVLRRLHVARDVFEAYDGNIANAYRDFQDMGKIEVITCAATHAFLPFYMNYPELIRAQLQTACTHYEKAFGRWPRGIWLPEHAYTPGLDTYLAESGIKWHLLAAHGLQQGDTRVFYDTARPVVTPAGVAAFGIDEETRHQIWSRDGGYPGDPRYKEWYRDLGYEMDWDHLPEYWKAANVRRNTGIKYYRITDRKADLGQKSYYHPEWAREAVNEHAGQFVYCRGMQAQMLSEHHGIRPITVSAYDAELFGHWWEEGPDWLEMVFRKMLFDQNTVRPCTPSEYLVENPTHQKMVPGASSWGDKDYFATWLDGREYQPNSWVYRHFYRLIDQMVNAANEHRNATGDVVRALNQAARCLSLAMASDWAFLIYTGQAVRYSELQMTKHIDRARALLGMVERKAIDETYLRTIEYEDNIFPGEAMDFRRFCRGF